LRHPTNINTSSNYINIVGWGRAINSVVQLQSVIVMTSTPKNNCFACDTGLMVKPEEIHSYDFIEEGYVPNHCIECGICSDSRDSYIQMCKIQNQRNGFSTRNLKKILRILCNQGEFFDYSTRDVILAEIRQDEHYKKRELNRKQLTKLILIKSKNNQVHLPLSYVFNTISMVVDN